MVDHLAIDPIRTAPYHPGSMNYFDLRTVSEAILDLARRQQAVLVAIDSLPVHGP